MLIFPHATLIPRCLEEQVSAEIISHTFLAQHLALMLPVSFSCMYPSNGVPPKPLKLSSSMLFHSCLYLSLDTPVLTQLAQEALIDLEGGEGGGNSPWRPAVSWGCVCTCEHKCAVACTPQHVESLFTFYLTCSGDWSQVVRLGGKHLNLLSPIDGLLKMSLCLDKHVISVQGDHKGAESALCQNREEWLPQGLDNKVCVYFLCYNKISELRQYKGKSGLLTHSSGAWGTLCEASSWPLVRSSQGQELM